MELGELQTGDKGIQEIADALHAEHRTTQSLVAEPILKGLLRWATECRDGKRTDLRNARAVKKTLALLETPDDRPDGDDQHLFMYTC